MGANLEEKNSERRPDFRALFTLVYTLLGPRLGLFVLGVGLILVNRASSLVLPGTTRYVIDEVVGRRKITELPPIIVLAVLATLLQAVSTFVMARTLSRGGQVMIAELRSRLQVHLGKLALSFYDRNKTGVLVSRIMTDVEGIWNLLGTGFVEFAGSLLTALLAFLMLLHISTKLTAVVCLFVMAFIYALVRLLKVVRPIHKLRSQTVAEVTGRLTESLGGVRVVKGYAAESHESDRFSAGLQQILRVLSHIINLEAGLGLLSMMITSLTGIWVVYEGIHMVIRGDLTLGSYLTYNIFLAYLIAPLSSSVSMGTQLNTSIVGLDRALELLEVKDEHSDSARVIHLRDFKGEVCFEQLNFSYVPGKQVLYDISFSAWPSQVLALVGPSGSGKSTIASLICAFHMPDSGRVLVDGNDLKSVVLSEYRQRLGVVFQDTFLFQGSIRENVAFARTSATMDEILRVCRIARVNEFAERWPEGYDTIVGERGVTLSGGQKQCISIARALLADPRILILDEATSSLDSESEQYIQAGLAELIKGRTTIMVAHRLSTVQTADKILVLERGRIVERGSHSELLNLRGRYRALYDSQLRRVPTCN